MTDPPFLSEADECGCVQLLSHGAIEDIFPLTNSRLPTTTMQLDIHSYYPSNSQLQDPSSNTCFQLLIPSVQLKIYSHYAVVPQHPAPSTKLTLKCSSQLAFSVLHAPQLEPEVRLRPPLWMSQGVRSAGLEVTAGQAPGTRGNRNLPKISHRMLLAQSFLGPDGWDPFHLGSIKTSSE